MAASVGAAKTVVPSDAKLRVHCLNGLKASSSVALGRQLNVLSVSSASGKSVVRAVSTVSLHHRWTKLVKFSLVFNYHF